jgi:AraC-like DNA-binding protein
MSDFASAAMMRLIREGLIAQKISILPAQATTSDIEPKLAVSAHAPLLAKRALLQGILQTHGSRCLLNIGQAVKYVSDEPALTALTLARNPMDLIRRWQQLEKFIHSRHRVQVLAVASDRATLQHVALGPEQPNTAEHLVVFGLLCALIERIDGWALTATCLSKVAYCRSDSRWNENAFLVINNCIESDTGTWEFEWTETATNLVPKDAVVVDSDDRIIRARSLIAGDPSYRWSLDEMAQRVQLPVRSFQRFLAEQGSSFSNLLKNERLSLAAAMLARTNQAPSEIGYSCGFSDQSHFSREFKRHTAMTPKEYRESFSTNRTVE